MRLGINNHDQYQFKRMLDATKNNEKFKSTIETMRELGENHNMITNLDDMRFRLDILLEEGRFKQNDSRYRHLETIVEQAQEIHITPNKSLEDITGFYESYTNFNDVYKSYEGEKK